MENTLLEINDLYAGTEEKEILKEEPKNEDLPKEKNDDDKNNTNNQ